MKKSKTCVVLGGSGFVGQTLINQLCDLGHRVVVPTRNIMNANALAVQPNVKIVACDVHDPQSLDAVVKYADVVINLVGILNERGHHRGRGFYKAHTDLAANVLRSCRANGVRRLLQMSSLKADAKEGPSHYLRSKGEAEKLVRAAIEAGDIDATIFQPSIIFGRGDASINRFAKLMKLFPILPLARPNARFAPVSVRDVGEAFCVALGDDETIGKTYQLCGPKVYSLRELVTFVRDSLALRCWIIGLPDSVAKIQARIFDFLPGKPFSTDNYRSLTVQSICDENGLKALGIEPKSLEKIATQYLEHENRNVRYSRFRERANR